MFCVSVFHLLLCSLLLLMLKWLYLLVNRGVLMPNHSKVAAFATGLLHNTVLMPDVMKQNVWFEPLGCMYFFLSVLIHNV